MWAQTRDRAAAMLAHVVVSIGKLDAIPTDRRCARTWSWHHHRRRRPVLGSSAARQDDALWTRVLLAMVDLLVNRTRLVAELARLGGRALFTFVIARVLRRFPAYTSRHMARLAGRVTVDDVTSLRTTAYRYTSRAQSATREPM